MQKKSTGKSLSLSIQWGFKASILMILLTLVLYFITGSGYRPVPIWNHFLLLIMLFISVNSIKNRVFKGYLNFKQCYTSGLLTGIVVAVIFGIYMFFHSTYIDKQLITNNITANEKALAQYLSGIELRDKINALHQNTTSISISIKAAIELLLMSIFLPLLVSIFLKKEKNNDNSKSEVVEIE